MKEAKRSSQADAEQQQPSASKISSLAADEADDDSARLLVSGAKLASKMGPGLGRRLSKSRRRWFPWAPAIISLLVFGGGVQGWPQFFARPQGRQNMELMPLMLADMAPAQFSPPPLQILQPANLNQNLQFEQPQPPAEVAPSPAAESQRPEPAAESKPAGEEAKPALETALATKLVELALDRPANVSKGPPAEGPALQVLRPRKEVVQQQQQQQQQQQPQQPQKPQQRQQQHHKQAASAEEQIISQHARLHLTGQHQRLLPTKQRDQRVSAALAAGRPDRSPLAGLLGQLKSAAAISSRQSIVKAISDNRLARTLSTLGKSISGNKYVAGAAAASAVAALGLTVSKLLTPYLYAGGYSKLAEPLLPAGSLLQPIFERNNAPEPALAFAGSALSPSYAARPAYFQAAQEPPEPAASHLYFTYRPASLDAGGHYGDFYRQAAAAAPDPQQPDQVQAAGSAPDAALSPPQPPPRRSGPLARIKLDEAARQRLYELLLQQQSQAYALELAPPDFGPPAAKLTRSASLQLDSAELQQQQQQRRPEWGRSAHLHLQQPARPQQGQSVPKTIPPAAYLIIKPQKVANGPDVLSLAPQAAAEQPQVPQVPQVQVLAQVQPRQPPEAPISPGNNWRAAEPARRPHSQAWLVSGGERTLAEDGDHKHRQQQPATGEPAPDRRLSRTPPASVKAPGRHSVASHLASEQQDQYEPRKNSYAEAPGSSPSQPAPAPPPPPSLSADAKTNLIQLGAPESGDNDSGGSNKSAAAAKLIEVHTSGETVGPTAGHAAPQAEEAGGRGADETAARSSPRGFSALNAGTIGD